MQKWPRSDKFGKVQPSIGKYGKVQPFSGTFGKVQLKLSQIEWQCGPRHTKQVVSISKFLFRSRQPAKKVAIKRPKKKTLSNFDDTERDRKAVECRKSLNTINPYYNI